MKKKIAIGFFGVALIIFIGVSSSVDKDYVPPEPVVVQPAQEVVDDFELGMYRVESEEFQYMEQSEVNLWQSYTNRTKTGSVSESDEVEVVEHDVANNYCKVEVANQTGWIACGWLVKVN